MSKKIMALATLLSLIAGAGLSSVLMFGETAYFCEDIQQICIGTRLSGSGITCYYIDDIGETHGKQCRKEPHWQVYENQELEKEMINYSTEQKGQQWKCPHEKCIPIEDK